MLYFFCISFHLKGLCEPHALWNRLPLHRTGRRGGGGGIDALAGGGTLITFPMLTALGVPAVVGERDQHRGAVPRLFGHAGAVERSARGRGARRCWILPAGVLGGSRRLPAAATGEKMFQALVPFLILLASVLLAVQEPLRAWLKRPSRRTARARHRRRPGGPGRAPSGLAACTAAISARA